MKMKITTVRITDVQHTWITRNHPQQLSHLVREHLDELMQQKTPVNFHNAWRESAQKCYPFLSDGYCAICWPGGIPARDTWQRYLKENSQVTSRFKISWEEWIMNNHHNRQSLLDEWNKDTDVIPFLHESNDQERTPGFLVRLWSKLFGK
jgi:hypothetical protein